jgi:hypothetical protein
MTLSKAAAVMAVLTCSFVATDAFARGGGGGGGGFHGGGGGGGYHDGGGFGGYGGGGMGGYHSSFGGGYHPSFGGGDFHAPAADGFRGDFGAASHAGVPGFGGERAGEFAPRGEHATADQLSNFLNIRPGAGEDLPRPEAGGFSHDIGYAGNHASWAGDHNAAADRVRDQLNQQFKPDGDSANRMRNWQNDHPERQQQLRDTADRMRDGRGLASDKWNNLSPATRDRIQNHFDHNRPGSDWWNKNHSNLAHWYYHNAWNRHDWRYWWNGVAWGGLVNWFPMWGYPVYYDYGAGGNVVYQPDGVYVDGQCVGTAAEYAQSAANLATVDSTYNDSTPADDDFLPLGTFSLATGPEDTSPTRVLQFAVDKQGIISGSMYNSATNQTYIVQGKVDKTSQRAAFTVGDKADTVLETGIYNLTQDHTTLLVHYSTGQTGTFYLVRMSAPSENATPTDSAE